MQRAGEASVKDLKLCREVRHVRKRLGGEGRKVSGGERRQGHRKATGAFGKKAPGKQREGRKARSCLSNFKNCEDFRQTGRRKKAKVM